MSKLKAVNVTKTFPGVKALDDVSIEFEEGKIHGIIGENGAGKSTFVKILTGVYKANQGNIFLNEVNTENNKSLFKKVSYVPQEIDLFQHMTVAENLFMPFEKSGFNNLMINKKRLINEAIPWLDDLNIKVDPSQYVKDISISNQQLLQITRALTNKNYEILILDEPTTSLTQQGTEYLFKTMKKLKEKGKSIIFISHKLEEVFEICDEVTILRNGKKVGHAGVEEIDNAWIVEKMSGRKIDEDETFRPKKISDDTILAVEDLSGINFSNISFKLKKGEILGFSGLVGAGRTEIMQTIFGFLPAFSGEVTLENKEFKLGNTNYSVEHGLFYLPEERKQQGILKDLSVKDNISISLLEQITNNLFISFQKENKIVDKVIDNYSIKTTSKEKLIKFLSGGNQQKVIIGRTMACEPKVIIFDEPTKGIDVGTKRDIYKLMKELAETGISIILVSSELDEIMKCANRIITIYEGEKINEFNTEEIEQKDIVNSIIGERV